MKAAGARDVQPGLPTQARTYPDLSTQYPEKEGDANEMATRQDWSRQAGGQPVGPPQRAEDAGFPEVTSTNFMRRA